MQLLRLPEVAVLVLMLLREKVMRCPDHCPPAGAAGIAVAAAGSSAAVAGGLSAAAGLAEVAWIILAVLAAACAAGVALLVHLLRQPVALYRPHKAAAIPASHLRQLPGRAPRALDAAPPDTPISGVVVTGEPAGQLSNLDRNGWKR